MAGLFGLLLRSGYNFGMLIGLADGVVGANHTPLRGEGDGLQCWRFYPLFWVAKKSNTA